MNCRFRVVTDINNGIRESHYARYRRLAAIFGAVLLTAMSLREAAGSDIIVESAPAGATVFGEQRGSMYFYGFTPLQVSTDTLEGDRLRVTKTGYAEQKFKIGNRTKIAVNLAPDPAIESVPDALRRACPSSGIEAYSEMADAFRSVPTSLQIETPFTALDVDDRKSLVIAARVVDRKTRADLRGIRRREGRQVLEAQLEAQIKPVVEAVLASVRKIPCTDYLTLRVFYSSTRLALDTKRIQVPWMQSYVYQQGSDTVYETKYGMRGENVTTIKVSDGDGNYVDFFYRLRSE